STKYIKEVHLRLDTNAQTRWSDKAIAEAMRKLGWSGPKLLRFSNDVKDVRRGYFREIKEADNEQEIVLPDTGELHSTSVWAMSQLPTRGHQQDQSRRQSSLDERPLWPPEARND